MTLEKLNHKINLYFKRQKLRQEGQEGISSVMEDLDEFDFIVL